jgi:hypothetical protein
VENSKKVPETKKSPHLREASDQHSNQNQNGAENSEKIQIPNNGSDFLKEVIEKENSSDPNLKLLLEAQQMAYR